MWRQFGQAQTEQIWEVTETGGEVIQSPEDPDQ